MNILNVKYRIKRLLEIKPELRDSDERLLANIWYEDIKEIYGEESQRACVAFLSILADGKLSSPESCRRSRQKWQEEHPELRGKNYGKRQNKQKKVKKDLKLFKEKIKVYDLHNKK